MVSDIEVVEQHGLPSDVIVWSLQREIEIQSAFLTLPRALLLVIVYSCSFLAHDGGMVTRDMEDAINVDLRENAVFAYVDPGWMAHKDVEDVHNIADVYSWLRVGLRPLILRNIEPWSEVAQGEKAFPEKKMSAYHRPYYLQYNQIIGGAQLKQLRAPQMPCVNLEVSDRFNMACYPEDSVTTMNFHLPPQELQILMNSDSQQWDPSLTRWFLVRDAPDDTNTRFKQLEQTSYIDNTTAQLTASFMTYNAHFDTLTLTGAHFFFSRSGHVWKTIVHSSFFLDPYKTSWVAIFDVLFCLLITWISLEELLEIFSNWKARQSRCDWISNYWNMWNVIDWISIGGAISLIVMWYVHCMNVQGVQEGLLHVKSEEDNLQFGDQAFFERTLEDFFAYFNQVVHHYHNFRMFASLFPMTLMLRLFKAFDAQPRLALVTRTLSSASVDVAHFSIVFLTIFLTYVMMGTGLFGRHLDDFSTFARSLNTCFVMLMGDFDAPSLWATGRPMAAVWFWSFHLIIILLLLNMLLAIIMDTYSDVKTSMGNTDTLWGQSAICWRRFRELWNKERVSLHHIRNGLADMHKVHDLHERNFHDPQCLTHWTHILVPSTMVLEVSGLQEPQARRVLLRATLAWRVEVAETHTIDEVVAALGTMQIKILASIQNGVEPGLKAKKTSEPSNNVLGPPPINNGIDSNIHIPTVPDSLDNLVGRMDKIERRLIEGQEKVEGRLKAVEDSIAEVLRAVQGRDVHGHGHWI